MLAARDCHDPRMTETAIIVKVPETERHVGGLRDRFDASSRLGVSAHATVLYPFMSPELITPPIVQAIDAAFDSVQAFAQPFRCWRIPHAGGARCTSSSCCNTNDDPMKRDNGSCWRCSRKLGGRSVS